MNFELDSNGLLDRLQVWDSHLKRPVRIVTCGEMAFILLGLKESTYEVDLLVPETDEYERLLRTLRKLDYRQIDKFKFRWRACDLSAAFNIYPGTWTGFMELIESPLIAGNHTLVKRFDFISLGVLNDYDLLLTKLFTGTVGDLRDCLALFEKRKESVDLDLLKDRFEERVLFSPAPERRLDYLARFLSEIGQE